VCSRSPHGARSHKDARAEAVSNRTTSPGSATVAAPLLACSACSTREQRMSARSAEASKARSSSSAAMKAASSSGPRASRRRMPSASRSSLVSRWIIESVSMKRFRESADQAEAQGLDDGLPLVDAAELAHGIAQVVHDGAFSHAEDGADLPRGLAFHGP